MIRYNVTVRNERNDVSVTHKRKALWVATGKFRGTMFEGKGRSEPAALRAWEREVERSLQRKEKIPNEQS